MGNMEQPTTRAGPAEVLHYGVIIHLDFVFDFSPLPGSPSHRSIDSVTSGLPDDFMRKNGQLGIDLFGTMEFLMIEWSVIVFQFRAA